MMNRKRNLLSRTSGSCMWTSLLCLLPSINASSDAAFARSLTSENNALESSLFEFNLRADSNIKIKHKCANLDYIVGPIHNADVDENGVLNQEEYVVFVDAISGGWLTENDRADGFLDMPLALQETYVVLSCLCELYQSEPWGGKGCCTSGSDDDIGIQTGGTAPDEELTKAQGDYFSYVCGTMTEVLDGFGLDIVSPPPTGEPSKSPDTESPTTVKPSKQPTNRPIKEPTREPTNEPTDVITTLAPTTEQTETPTRRPSLRPVTSRPTAKPSIKEPIDETSSPTVTAKSDSPTSAPITVFPTLVPTEGSSSTPSPEGLGTSQRPSSVTRPTAKPVSKPPSSQETDVPTLDGTTKAPSVDGATKAPSVDGKTKEPSIDGETKAPSVDGRETKAPSPEGVTKAPSVDGVTKAPSPEGQTKAPSAVEETKMPSSDAAEETKSPSLEGETKAPSAEVTDAPQTNAPTAPTFSPAPTAPTPSPSKSPSDGAPSNAVPVPISFTLEGVFTDEELEVILSGEDNQFNNALEDSLMELVQEVYEEEFGNSDESTLTWTRKRYLQDSETPATVTIDSVEEIDCPEGTDSSSTCLDYEATIDLSVPNEADFDEGAFTEKFQNAINAKIADGWLTENFDVEKALSPTQAPVAGPSPDTIIDENENERIGSGLTTQSIILICVGALFVFQILVFFIYHAAKGSFKRDDEFDLERQAVSETAAKDMQGPSSQNSQEVSDSWSLDDASEAQTKSYSSQDHLLPENQIRSTASPKLENLEEEEDWSESDANDSTFDSTMDGQNTSAGSGLAAVGMASTFVSANAVGSSQDLNESGTSDNSRGVLGAQSSDNGGMSDATKAALGAAGVVTAGALAAGAYAATKDGGEPQDRELDASQSNLDDLDSAIESGNWGAVGAIAAILASSGHPPKKEPRSVVSAPSEDSSAISGSRDSSNGPTLDQARASEIDKLVEAGDWQGVVLAAARFEADQTMDGESYSASASKSSYRSGSAQSSATPKSIASGATSGQSSTIHGSGRSQAEIKAEIEALVRRVVPEEADNVDEMLTQFKGREEELVETLRRMQERAIASRARLAVQKSAKLEARARSTTFPAAATSSSTSVGSRASTKSELEAAIEAGNWEAVGQAAQKMSEGSVASLSVEDRTRLSEKVSASPGLAQSPGAVDEDNNLDALIERGDWPGVIAAAKRASEGTRVSSSNMTQEEQDALAQANMWQEIANQSKGRQGPAGADDAAAWAISRSLNALNAPQGGPVRTIEDMDEESSEASHYESSSYSASKSQSMSSDYYKHGI